jgi:hypothetical protein
MNFSFFFDKYFELYCIIYIYMHRQFISSCFSCINYHFLKMMFSNSTIFNVFVLILIMMKYNISTQKIIKFRKPFYQKNANLNVKKLENRFPNFFPNWTGIFFGIF